jgi:hypothetical protein
MFIALSKSENLEVSLAIHEYDLVRLRDRRKRPGFPSEHKALKHSELTVLLLGFLRMAWFARQFAAIVNLG